MLYMRAFYGTIAKWRDKGIAVDVIYLAFSEAFDTVTHNILTEHLRRCGTDSWSVRWSKNCLDK